MKDEVYLIGVGMTHFKRWLKRDHIDLAREALTEAIQDADLTEGQKLARVWFGNCGMHYWGQSNIRGQAVCESLSQEGLLAEIPEIINVEGGCATGSLALYGAIGDLLSGRNDFAVALGVEKTFIGHNPAHILELFTSGMNKWSYDDNMDFYRAEAERLQLDFKPASDRIILLDVSALHAKAHMNQYGVTQEQLAFVASKSHSHGALNPKAQYQTEMSPEMILADHEVLSPFTRSMCAPISDGAAAVILVSGRALHTLTPETQDRAIPVAACELAGGIRTNWAAESPTQRAAKRAYLKANLMPSQIQIAEVHDATAYAEILHLESLGFCSTGEGAKWSVEGHSHFEGSLPINTSGGLISKGHPLGASGIAMVRELVKQLRGEAGKRQVKSKDKLKWALSQNGGGLLGFQEASTVVTILGAPR